MSNCDYKHSDQKSRVKIKAKMTIFPLIQNVVTLLGWMNTL